MIGLPRSSWYYASSRKQGGESEENLTLMRQIDELYLKHPFYGSRKMAFELDANRKRVQRLILKQAKPVRLVLFFRAGFLGRTLSGGFWGSRLYGSGFGFDHVSGFLHVLRSSSRDRC